MYHTDNSARQMIYTDTLYNKNLPLESISSHKKSKFELELLSNAIVDLYVGLKNKTVRGGGEFDSIDSEEERKKL